MQFLPSELILNPDGSIYHLHLLPEHIADTIITVGDQDRVAQVSKHFDRIEHQINKREFVTHTGYIGNKRLTVISTGIGTDNIDIVLNELDALVNIDLSTRTEKREKTSLNIIRIGTSGTIQPHINVDSILLSKFGLSLDALFAYYHYDGTKTEQALQTEIDNAITITGLKPKVFEGSNTLFEKINQPNFKAGITASCCGFYAPQGRILRAQPSVKNFTEHLGQFKSSTGLQLTNLEMETSALYGLSNILGHQCLSVNAILANRATKEFSQQPKVIVEQAIKLVLEQLCA